MSAGRGRLRRAGAPVFGALGCMILVACMPESGPPAGATAGGDEPIASTYEGLRAQGANLERGRVLSLACVPCHSFAADAAHSIGPNLHQVFGRAAGTRGGYAYSLALQGSGIVWSPATLDRWLAEPTDFVPGTSMVFAGYTAAADRRDLIVYLLRETGGPAARSADVAEIGRLDRPADAEAGAAAGHE
jgi:cytochrome c